MRRVARALSAFLLISLIIAMSGCTNQKTVDDTANAPLEATTTSAPSASAPSPSPTPSTPTPSASPTRTAVATPLSPFVTGSEFACIHATLDRTSVGIVTRVVDGDTIHVAINGTDYAVRYIGIDTPEDTSRKEWMGHEAAQRDKELVAGKRVVLVKDVSETDRYGRLLRYVFVDNIFVNYELVREGYAKAVRYPPDTSCAQTFYNAQLLAQQEHRGLWVVGSAS